MKLQYLLFEKFDATKAKVVQSAMFNTTLWKIHILNKLEMQSYYIFFFKKDNQTTVRSPTKKWHSLTRFRTTIFS
jgi:hypothetical protein